ncbi:MAG: bifunctional DNA-formamidopyrimidine glycosylase/DNA-(apurinic or apyrimidinic site) lyase [Bryobacteraceae bacterium]|nr:bifunctional DNA-formamidopyrimidine glycosylase/DNA-(apurinic or apyrimidinic site) lyase [Bryobacteraceae bacterium]
MPELPEVETIVRSMRPRLVGRHINSVEVLHPRIVRYSKLDVPTHAAGRKILDILRHGKFILLVLDSGFVTIHLGMTGQVLFDSSVTKWTRAIFSLDDATMLYDDIRMFGSIEYSAEMDRTTRLGPDALTLDEASLALRRRAPIKAVLLNQSVFAGVGNIYADESLFRAGIHPRRRADRLSKARASNLLTIVKEVLAEAVAHRGSSLSDYVDTEGRKGSFQTLHRVYGREGEPCPACGEPIRKTVVAQRGTHYCPKCQR